jgi:nitroimidazol reductase NimA-like FMN-containing flavoprotein (pyridoxamine 5'-phosphate oxidase superfamily)
MPEGYSVPKGEEGTLSWSQIQEALEEARIYWLSTTRPDGSPHPRPVWGVWVDDRFYFDGHPQTRWARNIERNPAAAVHIEMGDLAVIVEGVVEDVTPDSATSERVAAAYDAKYNYRPGVAEGIFMMRSRVAFAWDEYLKRATRWRFGEV